MSSLLDNLELFLQEFSAKDFGELMKKRTTDKVVKSAVFAEAPKLVGMTADQCKKLCEKAGLKYKTGYEKRVIERVTTTEAVDRYGDIVRYKGIDNENYRKNAVVLFAHEHGNFPVGKSLKEWIDHSIKGWRSWDLYLDDEVDTTGRSDLTFRMVESGAMPAGSIGFMPRESRTDFTPAEREKIGLGKWGVEYITCEKLEHSACSVPANPEALTNFLKSVESKRMKAVFGKSEVDRLAASKMLDDQMLDVFAQVLGVKRTVSIPSVPVELVEPVEPVLNKTVETTLEEIKQKIDKWISQPIVINNNLSEFTKTISEFEKSVEQLTTKLEEVSKSSEEKFERLMSTTQKALSALEARKNINSLYDKADIERVLAEPIKL